MNLKHASFALSIVTLALAAAPVRAETTHCTRIDALPYTISAGGVYCLAASIEVVMAGAEGAITINADNVVLDLNGHRIENFNAPFDTQAYGVYALNRRNITVKNGTIRGFLIGILLQDNSQSKTMAKGNVIEAVRAELNRYQGFSVEGSGNVVRSNVVLSTGGTTYFGPNVSAYGIRVVGRSPRVIDNEVFETYAQGTGSASAIFVVAATDSFVVANRVSLADYGVRFSNSTGKYKDNLTGGVTNAFSGGTNAGDNN